MFTIAGIVLGVLGLGTISIPATRRWVGLRLGLISGAVQDQNDRLMRNPTLIRAEGEAAAAELKASYATLYGVIAGKVTSRTEKETRIKHNGERLGLIAAARSLKITAPGGKDAIQQMGYQLSQLSKGIANAAKKLRDRATAIGALDADGNVDQQSPIGLADIEFVQHNDAFNKMGHQRRDLLNELDELEASLKTSVKNDTDAVRTVNAQLISDKGRLREMERGIADLPGQIEDIISDVLGAEEAKKRNAVLQSIDTSNADNRLANLKKLQQKAIAEGQVANEMINPTTVDDQYLTGYTNDVVDSDLDAILNPNRGQTVQSTNHNPEREADDLPTG